MHFSSIRRQNLPGTIYHRLTWLRSIGGGSRIYPGGLNPWQWKRLQDRKAREKEKNLLDQENHVSEARTRSQIRAKRQSAKNSLPEKPVTPADEIKALADRFMKEGAEDLWNDADGPLEISRNKPARVIRPIDLPKLLTEKRERTDLPKLLTEKRDSIRGELNNGIGSLTKSRRYWSYVRRIGDVDSGIGCLRTIGNSFGLEDSFSNLHMRRYHSVGASNAMSRKPNSVRKGTSPGKGDGVDSRLRSGKGGRDSKPNFVRKGTSPGKGDGVDSRLRSGNDGGHSKPNFIRKGTSPGKGDGVDSRPWSGKGGGAKWPAFRRGWTNSSDDDTDEEGGLETRGSDDRRSFTNSAASGEYVMKMKSKRIPLQFVEDLGLSEHVKAIRMEFNRRKAMQEEEQKPAEEEQKPAEEGSILSSKRFDECGLSSFTVQALKEAGYVQMTNIQEATLAACLDGKDVLVKARAGTGKSIAYLLPAIETVLKISRTSKRQRITPILVLILCPTRGLASQISAEANVLLKHHDGIGIQTLIGGTRFKEDQRNLESDPCQIIVATPGRLLDHIENKSCISTRLRGLQMLVLDEADHMLDLGFQNDVEEIVDCLPQKRQSLLFSASMPKEVRRLSQLVLKREHIYIDTSGVGCLETLNTVKQFYLVAPHDQHLQIVHHLLKSHKSQVPDYKIVVFCATAKMASLLCSLLREMKLYVRELHSQKSPLYRRKVSDEFKESKELILITSDAAAQGIIFPGVTLVTQVGIPLDREQYISKIGRTGLQGKEGEAILLLAPWEQYFLGEVKDLPLEKYPMPDLSPDAKLKIAKKLQKIDDEVKAAAYHAWLGYYNSIGPITRDKVPLVEYAKQFAASIGLQKPPPGRKTAKKGDRKISKAPEDASNVVSLLSIWFSCLIRSLHV